MKNLPAQSVCFKAIFSNCLFSNLYAIFLSHSKWFLTSLILVLLICEEGQTQDFQRAYGTSLDNYFTKVIQDGTEYYILGQDESVNGALPEATATRLDANGNHLWTLSTGFASQWRDAVLISGGDIILVGNTLPLDPTSKSIMARISFSGNFVWLKTINEPGRDFLTRIAENPIPDNPAYPYYITGFQNNQSGGSLADDVILMTVNSSGQIDWKKKLTITAGYDNEFAREMEILPSGDILLSGNVFYGEIYMVDNTGAMIGGLSVPITYVVLDVYNSSTGNIYACGVSGSSSYIMKANSNLVMSWQYQLPQLSSVRQIWESNAGELYVSGTAVFGNISRGVVVKLDDTGTSPTVTWLKYLNIGSNSTEGWIWKLSSNRLAYTDTRTIPGAFGQNEAYIAVTDSDLNTCNLTTTSTPINIASPTTSLPNNISTTIVIPADTALLSGHIIDWQTDTLCCSVEVQIMPTDSCGNLHVTAVASGPSPYTYQWCDGSTVPDFDTMITCGLESCFCVTVTCSDGTIASDTTCIIVTDTIKPTALCLGVGIDVQSGCKALVTPSLIDGGSFDNCQIISMTVYPDTLPACGTFPVTLVVTDWCQNKDSCSVLVQTAESISPTITCPVPTTVTGSFNALGVCEAFANLTPALASDNCGILSLVNNYNNTANASGIYPSGTTSIIWTATDSCMNSITCTQLVTVDCDTMCDPQCLATQLNISTGFDPSGGNFLVPGNVDPMWNLISCPTGAVNCNAPSPAQLIGPYGTAWSNPASTWMSAFPFNNYGVNNCVTGVQNCNCPPFVFERCFCLCETGDVHFNFNFWSDNNGSVELWEKPLNGAPPSLVAVLASNCNNINAVSNFTSPLSVNTTIPNLQKGRYAIRINNWNISGVAMGANLLGSVTGLSLEKDSCCANQTATICVTKYYDADCDSIRDINTTNWTVTEPGLPNWTFQLTDGTQTQSGVTNSLGQVCFSGLNSNTAYTVNEIIPAGSGWTPSSPAGGTTTVTTGSGFSTASLSFGNCKDTCICGPYDFLFSVGSGPLLPYYCGDLIQVPDNNTSFQFLAAYSCLGSCTMGQTFVDYVMFKPDGSPVFSNTQVVANPNYSIPVNASAFTDSGIYILVVTGYCNGIPCPPCTLYFEYPAADCCQSYQIFSNNVDNLINVSIDSTNCKVTLNIGNLPACDTVEWVNWGVSGCQQQGPFGPNSMAMCTFPGSGTYIISYLAVEKDPITNYYCFEKLVFDTINLVCLDTCCVDFEAFCLAADAATTITFDSVLCKVTLNIGDMPCDDFIKSIDWGDNQSNAGPFYPGDMPMHVYGTNGIFIMTYVAIEKDPLTGLICFEKVFHDTIHCDLVGTNNLPQQQKFRIFPNPTTDQLTLQFDDNSFFSRDLQINDILGRLLYEETIPPGIKEFTFSIESIPPGLYLVKVLEGGISIWLEKVVKE